MAEDGQVRRLLLGSGRSGTTWVLDCAANANALRPVFEPLLPVESALGACYAYQLLRPGDEEPALQTYFEELSAGNLRSRWIDYRGRRDRLFPSPASLLSREAFASWVRKWQKYRRDRRELLGAARREQTLIKCIRANLMAGWLTKTVGFRTVLIVRHPCAVVESQFRLGGVWDPAPVLDRYRANRRLHEITRGRYLPLLDSRLTVIEALTLNWVIENQWPVDNSRTDGYVVLHYEDLLSDPTASWQILCESLALERIPDSGILRMPSQQASQALGEPRILGQVPGWRARLTAEQLRKIQGVLDRAGCELYRIDDHTPLRFGAR